MTCPVAKLAQALLEFSQRDTAQTRVAVGAASAVVMINGKGRSWPAMTECAQSLAQDIRKTEPDRLRGPYQQQVAAAIGAALIRDPGTMKAPQPMAASNDTRVDIYG
ncbi:hypothetical protein [Parvularcula sp. LCG005]|uniref:hypothetical protein n=1 Tax=Parvularcula sp. LCG005 TaxID=3078805 RepID=UPI0029438C22|nr:hypothetical protein [Parvularcula sp. LCG005]WOI54322.1 hypothetical protein RUI03_04800 [Parvularcula sp. LCG005]